MRYHMESLFFIFYLNNAVNISVANIGNVLNGPYFWTFYKHDIIFPPLVRNVSTWCVIVLHVFKKKREM